MNSIQNAELARLAGNREVRKPPLFSRPYLEVISSAIDKGDISVRRVASLLCAPLEDIGEIFDSQGLQRPKELQF